MRVRLVGAALIPAAMMGSAPASATLANGAAPIRADTNPIDAEGASRPAATAPPANTVAIVTPVPVDPPADGQPARYDPPVTAQGSGVAALGVLILGGVALLLAGAAGIAAWLLSRQVAKLDDRVAALERRKRSASPDAGAPTPTIPLQPFDPERTRAHARMKGRTPASDETSEEIAAPAPPTRREPAVQAPTSSNDQLERLQSEIADLIARPGLRSSDYDAAVRRYGDLLGIEIAPDGSSARLVEGSADPKQRLIAVRLAAGSTVAILPSSRFVKEFPMTYKETLEAGVDVKHCYDCRIDGSAALKLLRIASAGVNTGDQVYDVRPGALSGFVR